MSEGSDSQMFILWLALEPSAIKIPRPLRAGVEADMRSRVTGEPVRQRCVSPDSSIIVASLGEA
jgi:hypothetical protein